MLDAGICASLRFGTVMANPVKFTCAQYDGFVGWLFVSYAKIEFS
jgi:hypothetical protein